MTLEPGIYLDVASVDYMTDPAPKPSLNQSLAKVLLERSPLHAWYRHPRLNPDFQPDDATKFDVGNIAHKIMIGRGKVIEVLDHNDWRTKAAQQAREDAAAKGTLAVLGKHYKRAQRMVRAAKEVTDDLAAFTEDGYGEVVIIWQEEGLFFRSMLDWKPAAPRTICYDYKTTDMSVEPHRIGRMVAAMGWDVQAAFQERGLNALDPANAGRYRFRFVAQETDLPHAVTVCELPESVMTIGRKKVARAIEIWKECVAANVYPCYPPEIVCPEYPGWAEQEWLNREIEDDEQSRREPMLADLAGG